MVGAGLAFGLGVVVAISGGDKALFFGYPVPLVRSADWPHEGARSAGIRAASRRQASSILS